GVYRLFGTPFGIKITPLVIQYIILSNKWGAVQKRWFRLFSFIEITYYMQLSQFLRRNKI
ncbi:hypothetical protein, partial [Anaerotignum lactatifermentans]|uniref:hypothetical protein n=1 Tax=Anaerotignum lactatifermentans TaxID=160404 RepID=UPI001A9C19BB